MHQQSLKVNNTHINLIKLFNIKYIHILNFRAENIRCFRIKELILRGVFALRKKQNLANLK